MDMLSVKQRFGIIGTSVLMDHALEVAVRVAATDLSVLVMGESGVGKEFFPKVIHAFSSRKHNKYIAVNCGAIPEGTIDSELFGHEKGSFTGASEARKGYFEEAKGGTIFLDEVSELPLSTQVRLLRVLQTGEYIRVGSSKIQTTDVRVVAATNINLLGAVGTGKFREDLYYRLNTVPILVPALRERKEDIHLLFRKFATDIATQYRMPSISLDDQARTEMEQYRWPGNIRQLKNVAEQISAVEKERIITKEILAKYLFTAAPSAPMVISHATTEMNEERDLLYKVLFDMRSEINELQRVVREMGQGKFEPKNEGVGFFTRGNSDSTEEPQFADTEDITDQPESQPFEQMTKERAEREVIMQSLLRHNGKRKEVAQELFMSERTLYRKLRKYGVDSK